MGEKEALQAGLSLRALLDSLFSVLLAPSCAACGDPIEHPVDGAVCLECWRGVPPHPTPFRLEGMSHCCAAGAYAGSLSAIVHALKYQGRTSLAAPLGALMARHCAHVFEGADCVVPVPLHASRLRERGFNQAALLAAALPLPLLPALDRVRPTPSQTDLPATQRRINVRGAFALARSLSSGVKGWRAVLVDDVATTGATLLECAAVLRSAGVEDVRAVTAARAL